MILKDYLNSKPKSFCILIFGYVVTVMKYSILYIRLYYLCVLIVYLVIYYSLCDKLNDFNKYPLNILHIFQTP